ncbi:chromosome segregation protein SMC [Bacillus fungorum]|uniref:chromosome segregation protein SMC n=1 Tax=Bacillus fungorum TaxID=2039284 RepID=UPI003398E18E
MWDRYMAAERKFELTKHILEKLKAMDSRLENLDSRLDKLDNRMDSLQGSFKGLQGTFEQGFADVRKGLNGIIEINYSKSNC